MPAPCAAARRLAAAALLLGGGPSLARSSRREEEEPGLVGPRRGAKLLRKDQVPLSTWERYIVDNRNERVKWACVNWAGAYMEHHAVLGLDRQHIDDIAARISELGFNCVRLPYSTQGVITNPVVADDQLTANPQLQGGRRMLDLFDAAVEALSRRRLMVIVNNHNSKSGWCCSFDSEEGLWYTPSYNESLWVQGLVTLAERYKNNTYVVAFDVRNEPHDYGGVGLTWGDGNPNSDWAAAAKRAGDAILQVHPNYLIVIEALCLAKDLRPLKQHQVELIVKNRVVYEVHAYHYFQMYSMWSDMFMSWLNTRRLVLGLALIPLAVIALLAWTWLALSRVWPPPGVLATSVGIWTLAVGMGGMVYRTAVWHSMRTTSCSIQATDEQLPLIIFWSLVAAFGLGLFGCGYEYHLGLRCLLGLAAERGLKRHAALEPAGGEELSDFAELASDEEEDATDEEVWELCCRRSDCASLGVAWKGLRSGVPQRASWDSGLCCGLQCGICSLVVFIGMVSLYVFANLVTSYWWFQRHHDSMWGFALIQGHEWTAPVWVGEFGSSGARGDYWLQLMQYLSARDVDWAYWVLNPEKPLTERYEVGRGWVHFENITWVNETWGVLNTDWASVRYPWKMLDLSRVMQSPARWMPQEYPCNRDIYGSECGG